MNISNRPLLFILLAILMWGFWGFFGKLALERKMAPTTVFLAEVLVGAVIAIPLLVTVMIRGNTQPIIPAVNLYGLLSGTVLALGLLFYYLALEHARVSVVVPLTASYPAVAVLLSYAILREKPTLSQWIGVLLVVIGATLLLSGPLTASEH